MREFKDLTASEKRINREQVRLARRLKSAEAAAADTVAESHQSKVELAEYQAETVRDFNTALREGLIKYDFEDPKELEKTIRARVRMHLEGVSGPIDVKAYATELIDKQAKLLKLSERKKFETTSNNKAKQVARNVKPTASTRPTSKPSRDYPAWSEAARRADGAAARAEAAKLLGD
jgi:hypothetical protein